MVMSADPRKGRRIVKGRTRDLQQVPSENMVTLDHAFQIFYSSKKAEGMRERTLEEYVNGWRYFREWLNQKDPEIRFIQQIGAEHLRSYVDYMSNKRKYSEVPSRKQTGETLSPYTVAFRLRILRTMFNFLHRENIIGDNPISNIKQPRFDHKEKDTLTEERLEKLLAAPDTSTYAGFRDRTLMMLLADGDLNRKPRMVPISVHVLREVLRLIDENQRYFNSDYIFLSNYGEPLKADHFRKRLKLYAKAAGIPVEIVSPHRFRSFFCRQFLMNGGDLFTLLRIVAHASIETTRRYVPMNDEMIRQQHEHFSPIARMGLSRINKRRL